MYCVVFSELGGNRGHQRETHEFCAGQFVKVSRFTAPTYTGCEQNSGGFDFCERASGWSKRDCLSCQKALPSSCGWNGGRMNIYDRAANCKKNLANEIL